MEQFVGASPRVEVLVARDLMVLVGRLRRRMREESVFGDLSAAQMSVLARLVGEGASTTTELAGREQIRPQSVAPIVRALEKRGLVERSAHRSDGRRQVLSPTHAGRARIDGGAPPEGWLVQELSDRYDEAELRMIVDALQLLQRVTTA